MKKRLVFSFAGLLFALYLILLGLYGFYLLTKIKYFSFSEALIVSGITPFFLGIATAIFILKLRKSFVDEWIIIIISIVCSLWIFEFYLGFLQNETDKTSQILYERTKNPETYPSMMPVPFLAEYGKLGSSSLLGLDGKEIVPIQDVTSCSTVFCREAGDYIIYKSDEKGFRNPKGIWSCGLADIVLVGDSYSHGACVCDGDDFPSLIRDKYPKTFNLAKGGNGPLVSLATIKEYANVLRPKLVIWQYADNDIGRDLNTEKSSSVLMGYLSGQTQHLFERVQEIDTLEKDFFNRTLKPKSSNEKKVEMLTKITKFFGLRLTRKILVKNEVTFLSSDYEMENIDWGTYERTLLEADRTVKSWGGKLVILIAPITTSIYHFSKDTLRKAQLHDKRLKDTFNKLDIDYISMDDYFSGVKNLRSYFAWTGTYYGHPNKYGYVLFAKAIFDFIHGRCVMTDSRDGLAACR